MNLATPGRRRRVRPGRRGLRGLLPGAGVRAARGRLLEASDDVVGAAPVAVVSDAFWRTRFGGDPGVVGSVVALDGVPTTIVGVAPPGFRFFESGGGSPDNVVGDI